MHIAVVADNIADRKQTERLLDRANTALSARLGTLYIDSFGDEELFLHACMKYDMFLLDFDQDCEHSLRVAQKLKDLSAPGLVAVCKAEGDPFLYKNAIQGLYTLNKPILPAPLHKLIQDIWTDMEKKKQNLTLIEIRGITDTRYVPKEDIISIHFNEDTRQICYHLAGGENLEVIGSLSDLLRAVGDYEEFEIRVKNIVINTEHIINESKKGLQLSNGESIEYPLFSRLPFFRK